MRIRRGLGEDSERILRGFGPSEDSARIQRTRRGFGEDSEDSVRIQKGFGEDSEDSARIRQGFGGRGLGGFGEDSARIRRGLSEDSARIRRTRRGFGEDSEDSVSEERARWPPKQPRHLIRSKPLRDTPNLKTSQSTTLMAAGVVAELCQNSQGSPPTAARNDRLLAADDKGRQVV